MRISRENTNQKSEPHKQNLIYEAAKWLTITGQTRCDASMLTTSSTVFHSTHSYPVGADAFLLRCTFELHLNFHPRAALISSILPIPAFRHKIFSLSVYLFFCQPLPLTFPLLRLQHSRVHWFSSSVSLSDHTRLSACHESLRFVTTPSIKVLFAKRKSADSASE